MPITLSAIHIYPVKALGGIALSETDLTPRGLVNDRRFMVVDPAGGFMTQRECPRMATVWVDIVGDHIWLSAPDVGSFEIPVPPAPGAKLSVWRGRLEASLVSDDADRFLSGYLEMPCRLVYMPDDCVRPVPPGHGRPGEIVSFADGFPLLLAAEASLADLNARIKAKGRTEISLSRFRPNLIIRDSEAYAEDGWREIGIGDAVFRVASPCIRCQVTTIDQVTGEVLGPEPLETLATYRNTDAGVAFGQNLIPVKLGRIRVGDEVNVLA
jgi:uncharacterized protein